jgi:predicted Fe-S protein YdhL (DUF1289 family)
MAELPSQIEMFDVPSPCIEVCQSGKRGYCLGCYRSREERLYWNQVDDATKRHIIKACYRRKRAALTRKNKNNALSDDKQQKEQQQQDLF